MAEHFVKVTWFTDILFSSLGGGGVGGEGKSPTGSRFCKLTNVSSQVRMKINLIDIVTIIITPSF